MITGGLSQDKVPGNCAAARLPGFLLPTESL
nr:MAG TPA: hypothetical protein [Caudoviricetes sp.]